MIERYQVHFIAKEHLCTALQSVPSAKQFLTEGWRFTKFVDLLHVRCNELSWAIPTKFALVEFIKSASIAYARLQLDKIGAVNGLNEKETKVPGTGIITQTDGRTTEMEPA